MKKLIILVLLLFSHESFAFDERKNIYTFPPSILNKLLLTCEQYYKEYYPNNPLPLAYYQLSEYDTSSEDYYKTSNYRYGKKDRLYYCMRKLIQTGDVEEDVWFVRATSSVSDNFTRAYEREIGKLPDEFYLISDRDERHKFINDALQKYYNETSEKEREKRKEVLRKAGNAVGIVNPPLGLMLQGVGAVQ